MIEIKRVYLPEETLGSFFQDGKMLCKTLELGWHDNKRSVSCIPEGEYSVTKEPPILPNDPKGRRERAYWHFRIHNVPGRSGILIHRISYVSGLKGCCGVGQFGDLNHDGIPDILNSSVTLQMLVDTLPDKFTLNITKK